MAFKKEQSYKYSLMAALLSGLIWIVCSPVWLVAIILYEAHAILLSRKLGVSNYGLETKRKRSFGGLAAAAVLSALSKKDALDGWAS